MKSILKTTLLLTLFNALASCQHVNINPSDAQNGLNKQDCTDNFEGFNDSLATAPIINDFAATERAFLHVEDKDYWNVSVKTASDVKQPAYLNLDIEGVATVKITASTSTKVILGTTVKGKTKQSLSIGTLTDRQTVTLLFEHLDGKAVCYSFSINTSVLTVL